MGSNLNVRRSFDTMIVERCRREGVLRSTDAPSDRDDEPICASSCVARPATISMRLFRMTSIVFAYTFDSDRPAIIKLDVPPKYRQRCRIAMIAGALINQRTARR